MRGSPYQLTLVGQSTRLANVVLAIRKEEVLGDQRPIVLLEENDGNGVS